MLSIDSSFHDDDDDDMTTTTMMIEMVWLCFSVKELIQRSRQATTDEESCHETDQESYIRTDDDDDGGNTEWEDALKRWVNR